MGATPIRSFCFFLLLRSLSSHPLSKEVLVTEHAEFDRNYTMNTALHGDLTVYHYSIKQDDVVRIRLTSRAANQSRPLLAVFRKPTSIISLQVPIKINDYMYNSAARTLCPYSLLEEYERNLMVIVELSSPRPIDYEFSASILDDFHLNENTTLLATASVSEPVFYQFTFPSELESVVIVIDSNSSICMTVSIEKAECPVFDFEDNVISGGGMYQTMTKSGSITVERRFFEKFFVIFMIRPNDDDCSRMEEISPPHPHYMEPREKAFRVTIQPAPIENYWLPIIVTVGLILLICIVLFAVFVTECVCASRRTVENANGSATSSLPASVENIEMQDEDLSTSRTQLLDSNEQEGPRQQLFLVLCGNDTVLDHRARSRNARAKTDPTVADLSIYPREQINRKFSRYFCSLLPIAVLYGLPVVQLVLTWQDTVREWGDLDRCWYNFRCARPFSVFFAFNNVISNIGYLFFGLLLLLMVMMRSCSYRSLCKKTPAVEKDFGLPRHNGLMYAIGLAVVMEGILSASYHICPTSRNFQFDTSFMYIIGLLGILKIYQLRHPDIVPNAHVSFVIAAVFILFAMMGVYLNTYPLFWAFVVICYLIMMVYVSVEFYFKGVNIRENCLSIFRELLSSKNCSSLKPAYKDRFFVLVLGNSFNLVTGYVVAVFIPNDFPSCLLAPVIVNLILYLGYYIKMKKFTHREKLGISAYVYFIVATICWGFALYFFLSNVSDWKMTPAGSRELNDDCILMSFYDNHDMWHLLSSVAIFLTFALIDCIDDDLQWVRRDKIAVF